MQKIHWLTLIGNGLALTALTLKSVYDLYWNPKQFQRELKTESPLEAARKKRERSDLTTAITFIFLAVAYLLFIVEACT